MAWKVLCEYCNKMLTPAVARKHKEEIVQANYLKSLGQTPIYVRNPVPPITAESVFGQASPPPTTADDSMDVDNIVVTPNKLSPPLGPLVADPNEHFPQPHHSIPENDFQPGTDQDSPPQEPYNEDMETAAIEEELHCQGKTST